MRKKDKFILVADANQNRFVFYLTKGHNNGVRVDDDLISVSYRFLR